jgi:FkbH-like protein
MNKNIATILNIGLDSMVFVDDNPAERNLVRKFLPLVAVPDLPLDPSGYVHAVEKHCYFETVGFSNEDRERASHYRTNVMRADLMTQFTDIGEYLSSLQMVSKKGNLDSFQLPRMAQLINKSNQFHLTGRRYSEAELISFVNRPNCVVRFYTLSDKFGDNGLISVVVLNGESKNQLTIDTWVMSCRVLGRTMEEFIYKDILDTARMMGATTIIGRYLPSEKNKLVSSLYARLGLTLVSDEMGATTWHEEISSSTKPLKTWVSQSS